MSHRSVPHDLESDQVASLQYVAEELRDEIRILRQTIDEFREDFTHCLRNLPDNLPPPYAHLGSMLSAFSNEPFSPNRGEETENETPEIPIPATEAPAPTVPAPSPPKPVVASPAKVASQHEATSNRPVKTTKHKQPLYMRMVFQPLLTDIVRIVGYGRWERQDLQQRLKTLGETYGAEKLEQAVNELMASETGEVWELSLEAAYHAQQILGKRPVEQTEKAAPEIERLSHAEAMELYEQHLKALKQRKRSLKKSLLKRFLTDELTLPDFVLGDQSLMTLVLLRAKLSEKEERDMQRWMELIDIDAEATVEWPQREGDDYIWHSRMVAARNLSEEVGD